MIKLSNITVHYGKVEALHDVSLELEEGNIVTLLGGNGAGKSTTLKTISGLIKPTFGTIEFRGKLLNKMGASEIVKEGIIQCPEGRQIFPEFTVQENLRIGAYKRNDSLGIKQDLNRVFGYFPRLKERKGQLAGTLSGGEQQMLAIGRALMGKPSLLLLDEPSLGLAPIIVQEIFRIIQDINKEGITILLVEQNVNMALKISNRGYILENGKIVLADLSKNLQSNDKVRRAYLGAAE